MPRLKNARREKVAQQTAAGIDGTHAYMAAYPESSYDSARANVVRVLASESVQVRIAELRAPADAAVAALLVDSELDVLRDYLATGAAALAAGHYGAAVAAINGRAKRHAAYRDAPTVDARTVAYTLPEGTTLADLRAMMAADRLLLADLRAAETVSEADPLADALDAGPGAP